MIFSEFIDAHKKIFAIIAILSMVLFFVSIFLIPFLVSKIPEDYFVSQHKNNLNRSGFSLFLKVIKNLFAFILFLLGVLMLFLPGQGIITILISIIIMDFPGKHRFELYLISRSYVLKSINWMRRKNGKEPLKIPEQKDNR